MTDHELLELAARAALGRTSIPDQHEQMVAKGWNPLKDDGDAQRLMVRMGVEVRFPHGAECVATLPGATAIEAFIPGEPHTKHAATRRAIVRAAAEIGRVMP